MARPERFELPTTWFVAKYSIRLSYGRIKKKSMRWRLVRVKRDGGQVVAQFGQFAISRKLEVHAN